MTSEFGLPADLLPDGDEETVREFATRLQSWGQVSRSVRCRRLIRWVVTLGTIRTGSLGRSLGSHYKHDLEGCDRSGDHAELGKAAPLISRREHHPGAG